MIEFSRFYQEFLLKLWENFVKFLKNFLTLFADIFYNDQKEYIKTLLGYCQNNSNWTVMDWVSLSVSFLINFIFIAFLLILIFQLLRRYLKFRKKEVEKDELIEEIALLNQRTLELIDEKNKILAMKVSQLGLSPDSFKDEYKIDKETKVEKEIGPSRFTKLSKVDKEYEYTLYTVHMTPDDMVTLPQLVDRFINFSASQLRLYYTKKIVSLYFAGMASSKVIILEGISGTGKTSLPYAMGKFFQNDSAIISVQPSWRDRAELLGYLNEFTKKFNETDFLKALYEASYRDDVNFIVLDEMNLARIEYYFAEFLSVMEMPDVNDWKIDLVPGVDEADPKNLINGKILVPQNLWFVGTANRDDSTYTITDKVYDRATSIEINAKASLIDAPYTESITMTYDYLDGLFKEGTTENPISPKTMESFMQLDDFIQAKFKIAFGNRIVRQIKVFVPVYVACGNTELEGLDYVFMRKVLRKFESLNLAFLKGEMEQLISLLDKLFGKNVMKESIEFLKELIRQN